MFLLILAKDDDIINVDNDSRKASEGLLRPPLKGRSCVRKPHGQTIVPSQSYRRNSCGEVLTSFCQGNVKVSFLKVELAEDHSAI